MKSIVFAGLIAASLSQVALADDHVRDVSVNGFGEISVAPDRATLSFAVEARDKNLDQARDQVSSVVAKTLAIADELGIQRKYVVSSHSNIRPEYTHHYKSGERSFSGYFVNRQVSVYLQDVELLGVVTEKLLDAGINNVSSPKFSHSKEEQLRRKALAAAATDARANAIAMAAALGNSVGDTLNISSNVQTNSPAPAPRMMKMASASLADGAAPAAGYSAGQIIINATVSARFQLK